MVAWLAVALTAAVAARVTASPVALFVNCDNGKDSNPGTQTLPFATLNHARDVLRQRAHPSGAVVTVAGTCYPRDAAGNLDFTVPVLGLSPTDSGASDSARVTYTAAAGGATLMGGVPIKASFWQPDADRKCVGASGDAHMAVVANLTAALVRTGSLWGGVVWQRCHPTGGGRWQPC